TGPFNSYIYNNTIFVKEDIRSTFSFTATTDGLLVANNIFYISGKTVDVSDGWNANGAPETIPNAVFKNNLYPRVDILPASLVVKDENPFFGNPNFKNAGGTTAEDYIPGETSLIKNKGIKIEKILNDNIGLTIGLKVEKDYFGNLISGLPDLGAVELK
ncbi:MAG: hypothetical protein J7L95_01315, partial [Prolixibacteraceae bacterium]|nr:hypothetical protein [Prolixibacteraceae bacterium]